MIRCKKVLKYVTQSGSSKAAQRTELRPGHGDKDMRRPRGAVHVEYLCGQRAQQARDTYLWVAYERILATESSSLGAGSGTWSYMVRS